MGKIINVSAAGLRYLTLDRGPLSLKKREDLGDRNPQFAAMSMTLTAKLLWP